MSLFQVLVKSGAIDPVVLGEPLHLAAILGLNKIPADLAG